MQQTRRISKIARHITSAIIVLCLLTYASTSFAQGGSSSSTQASTCDADFMNQIYARSFLEAEREIVMNSTIFRKPDSVLEYSCFDQFVSMTAHLAGPLFSETDKFHNIKVKVSVGAGGLGINLAAAATIYLAGLESGSAVSGLQTDALAALLPSLAPDSLIKVLQQTPLNVLQSLPVESLAGPLAKISPAQLPGAISQLSGPVQNVIQGKIQAALPTGLETLLGSTGTLQSTLSGLQTLDPTKAMTALSGVNAQSAIDFLNIVPDNILGQFNPNDLMNTLKGFSPTDLGGLAAKTITSLPAGVIQGTLGALSTSGLTAALGSFSKAAVASLPVDELTNVFQGLSLNEIPNLLNGLSGDIVNALPTKALSSALKSLSPAQLTQSLNKLTSTALASLSPAVLADTFSNLIPSDFSQVLNNLSLNNLKSLAPDALVKSLSSLSPSELAKSFNGFSSTVQQALSGDILKNALNSFIPTDISAALTSFSEDAIKNFLPGSLTEAFSNLSAAGILKDTLNRFDVKALAAVPAVSLISSLVNSPTDIFSGLSSSIQGAISKSITDTLPASITSILGGGTPASIINNLKNLDPSVLVAQIPGLSAADIATFINITPTAVLNNLEFVTGGLAGALALTGLSPDKLAGIVSTFSADVISALPVGEFTKIFSTFDTNALLKAFDGLSFEAIQNFAGADLKNIFSLPGVDFSEFVNNFTGDFTAFNTQAITEAFMNFGGNIDFSSFTNEQLLSFANSLSAEALPQFFQSLGGEQFAFLASVTSGVSLSQALSGLGGAGLFGFGISVTIPLDVYLGATKLDRSLEPLILEGLKEYVDTNFAHDFLGGAANGLNNQISASIGSDSYECQAMDQVWFLAKCRNFALDDSFLSFEDLISIDPRLLPEECPEGPTITQELIDLANNKDFVYVDFSKVRTFLFQDLLDPAICLDPIPTGVSVVKIIFQTDDNGVITKRQQVPFNDHVCSNPGCFYDFGGGVCRK